MILATINFLSLNKQLLSYESKYVGLKIFSAFNRFNKSYFGCFDRSGKIIFDVELKNRAHDYIILPKYNKVCLVARRPENFILLIDLEKGYVKKKIISPSERHFYGHISYSEKDNLIYVTENHYKYNDERSGAIAIYDPNKNFKRLGEIPSFGIGPHELKVSSNNKIVVANGGVLTHPDYPRIKLNLSDIDSNLVILDQSSAKLISKFNLNNKFKHNSIRHIDLDKSDNIYLGCQSYVKNKFEDLDLVFKISNAKIYPLKIPSFLLKNLHNYSGSIKVSNNKNKVYASFPKGNSLLIWNLSRGTFLEKKHVFDVCGISIDEVKENVYLSNGKGDLFLINKQDKLIKEYSKNINFDNHLSITVS
ncbi:MAG: hypothetical protein CFH34_01585 [Alphaproteobacteria bacterium MarineAlpha9_Bin4]|nr:MAG: hypothetical protein CFH34_01585 [Alphaproteobacteria bacterium MarineAlpha9_Bin4]